MGWKGEGVVNMKSPSGSTAKTLGKRKKLHERECFGYSTGDEPLNWMIGHNYSLLQLSEAPSCGGFSVPNPSA